MPAKKKTKKVDPVIDLLKRVEKLGSYVVCAPNKLKDKVKAFKYTANGKLTAKDKLRKDNIFKYLEMSREEKFVIQPKTKKGKAAEYSVAWYELSAKGQEVLEIYRLEEEHKKKEELQTVEGTKNLIAEHNKQHEKVLQVIKQLPEKQADLKNDFHEEMQNLQGNLQTEIENCHKKVQDLVKEIPKEQHKIRNDLIKDTKKIHNDLIKDTEKLHNKFINKMETLEKKFTDKLTGFTDGIESKLEDILQQVNKLQQNFDHQVKDTVSQSMDAKVRQLQMINSELPSCIAEYKTENNFLAQAVQEYVDQEKQKVLSKYSPGSHSSKINDSAAMEEKIVELLMPLLDEFEYRKIPDLYNAIKRHNVDISPGYFNDILLSLERKDKVILGDWNRTQESSDDYRHVIYRKYFYFSVKKGKKA